MVRHQAVRKNCNLFTPRRQVEQAQECGVVVIAFEQRGFLGPAIEDVKDQTRRLSAVSPGHGDEIRRKVGTGGLRWRLSSKNDSRPH
jgi:hypothetical protein